jgi:hypothetical protein
VSEPEKTPDSAKRQQPLIACPGVGQHSLTQSSNDVGNDAIGELLDFVLQRQLPLLHAREFQLVAIAGLAEHFDLLIEPTMLSLEQGQDLARIIVIHTGTLQHGRIIVTQPYHRRAAWSASQAVRFPSDKWVIS